MRILLIEDDLHLGDGLCRGLKIGGHTVDWLTHGLDAANALVADHFDVVILDLALPGRSGLEVLREWRSDDRDVPVLVLTAYDATDDCVSALDYGADDYMVKPFELDELEARLRAVTRRASGHSDNLLSCRGLVLDSARRMTWIEGEEIDLSAYEFKLLEILLERPGRAVGLDQLESLLYGWADGPESNSIQVLIHHLRAKIGSERIETVRGLGYRLASS